MFSSSERTASYSLYSVIGLVDVRLVRIKPSYNITRLPRSIAQRLKFWKASELRSWLLYYFVPILVDVMKPHFWYHYCSFVAAIYMLCKDSISHDDITSTEYLNYFVYVQKSVRGAVGDS